MRKVELKSRELLRKVLGCISFAAVVFVFQAESCEGEKPFYDIRLTGTVVSKTTNKPIKEIEIYVNDNQGYGLTDKKGRFDFYASVPNWDYVSQEDGMRYTTDSVYVRFFDTDGAENGDFANKTVIINPAHKNEVIIHVELENK